MSSAGSGFHPMLVILAIIAIGYAVFNFGSVKRALVGRPMKTRELHATHNKLLWFIALPILSADLYSSVAYGPEAGITELAHLGSAAKWYILPVTAATVCLLFMLIISYMMGVKEYTNGGGAYAIAKDNFKRPLMALIAASALLVDYVLTVAVSVSAGIQAMASAYPVLAPRATALSLLCVIALLIVNLRGVSESASVFAWPTLVFILAMVLLIVTGLIDELQRGFTQTSTPPFGAVPQGLTMMLLLRAFSSACSALTGIETISNAVPIFREGAKGAIKAYIALGLLTGATLLGFAYHLYVRGISVNPHDTMLSQLAALYFGHSVIYQVIMWSTFAVLIMAANSTFTGFPQLAALAASDRYLPRALTLRGDRLGYSNGMIVLAALSALLIEAFHAETDALIPLYAIGVFVAFTVAQSGLALRWFRARTQHWRTKAAINIAGAIVTALVSVIFAVTKFTAGAWIVLIILPVLVLAAVAIRRHYDHVADQLRIDTMVVQPKSHHVISVVLISGVHRVVLHTLEFAKSLGTDVIALYIGFDDASIEKITADWKAWGEPCRLITVKNEYRSLLLPLSKFVKFLETGEGNKPDHIHLLIAQFIPNKWWHYILHNQSAFLIRSWMLFHKEVVITTVPYHLSD